MTAPGRPRSERVAVAESLRALRTGLKILLGFWANPARVDVPGIGFVLASPEDQPENNLERLDQLAATMDDLSHIAQLIAERARDRATVIREARYATV